MHTSLRLDFFSLARPMACFDVRSHVARLALATLCLSTPACDHAAAPQVEVAAVADAGEPVAIAPGASQQPIDGGSVERAFDASVLDAGPAPGPAVEADAGPKRGYGEGGSICARPGQDAVRDLFCTGTPPTITSLRQLQDRLEINPFPASLSAAQSAALSPSTVLDSVVFMGLSTALAGQLVSPINPRMILLGGSTILAFQRGVQHVELASFDREEHKLNFFLLSFEQACNDTAKGCSYGDLFSPRIEADWKRVVVEDDEELKNTPLDCRQCHQRGSEQPVLLMRELRGPWLHFFQPVRSQDPNDPYANATSPLAGDYAAAKGYESYGGLPGELTKFTAAGLFLQNAVTPGQPVLFDSERIQDERGVLDTAGAAKPPRSATWDRAYAAFKRGEQLALPHYEERPTDPAKQAKLAAAYTRFRAGELPVDELPDLADIFPDDPHLRAEIGLGTEPEATPAEALIQACGSCHNKVLDQTLSRARFNIDLAQMSRQELDLAMARIALPRDQQGAMPPPGFRQLTADVGTRLTAYLRDNLRSRDDDAMLARAAALGMMGTEQY